MTRKSKDTFYFKHFIVRHDKCAHKVGTDGVLLGSWADITKAERILDIGTGTGLIALMLAQRCDAEIVAIEPDHDSFIQSCENISRSRWADRITVIESALQEFDFTGKFYFFVTNPPYFSDSIRNRDARKALARHNDTLTPADILEKCSGLLSENGRLQLIMPFSEGNVFIAEAADYGFFCHDRYGQGQAGIGVQAAGDINGDDRCLALVDVVDKRHVRLIEDAF